MSAGGLAVIGPKALSGVRMPLSVGTIEGAATPQQLRETLELNAIPALAWTIRPYVYPCVPVICDPSTADF